MNTQTPLLPCPFCNGTNVIVATRREINDCEICNECEDCQGGVSRFTVICDARKGGCGADCGYRAGDAAAAVAAWNRRAPVPIASPVEVPRHIDDDDENPAGPTRDANNRSPA